VPELPDIVVYIEALEKRIPDSTLQRVRIASPFLLRTAVPPLSSVEGKKIIPSQNYSGSLSALLCSYYK
jgi:formamidopyrimidine-DNA glycosylase